MIRLYFEDKTTFDLEDSCEDEVVKQMGRIPKKRLYVFGVDFSKVLRVEVIK